jgi:hypothetical protein
MTVTGDVDFTIATDSQRSGAVLPLHDSEHSDWVAAKLQTISL